MIQSVPVYTELANQVEASEDAKQFMSRVHGLTLMADEHRIQRVVKSVWTELKPQGFDLQDVMDYLSAKVAQILSAPDFDKEEESDDDDTL